MKVFIAGATGVTGLPLVERLVERGDPVVGMTLSRSNADRPPSVAFEPVVVNSYDLPPLEAAVARSAPDVVVHQLAELPDSIDQFEEHAARNSSVRRESTANLLAASRSAGVARRTLEALGERAREVAIAEDDGVSSEAPQATRP